MINIGKNEKADPEGRPLGIVVTGRGGARRQPALRAFVWGARRLPPEAVPTAGWSPSGGTPRPQHAPA